MAARSKLYRVAARGHQGALRGTDPESCSKARRGLDPDRLHQEAILIASKAISAKSSTGSLPMSLKSRASSHMVDLSGVGSIFSPRSSTAKAIRYVPNLMTLSSRISGWSSSTLSSNFASRCKISNDLRRLVAPLACVAVHVANTTRPSTFPARKASRAACASAIGRSLIGGKRKLRSRISSSSSRACVRVPVCVPSMQWL